ncbi:MAG TPA: branched-chain amino acid ABC transporter permease [Symbiobacteriaceae bacterium]|nr:branched-chain amino acid ABC transporter permease [Symbiobacteriaceae bacterium]
MLQQTVNGLSVGAVYALIAVGFALIFNVLKFSNFAHGGVITVSAYVGYFAVVKAGLGVAAAVLVAAISGGLCAVALEWLGFRRIRRSGGPLIYFFISSITLGILLENLMTIFFGASFWAYPAELRQGSLSLMGVTIPALNLYMLATSAATLGILVFVLYRTRIGIAIRAAACDLTACALMGPNLDVIIAAMFFVSGALAGISGVFLGMSYTLFPQIGQMVVKGFVAAVIGGLGSLSGAVIGAVGLGLLEVALTATLGSDWAPVLIFGVLVFFLTVRPQGVAGVLLPDKV